MLGRRFGHAAVIVALLFSMGGSHVQAAEPGPIVAYSFDVDQEGTVVDASGNGRDGSCTPGSTCPAHVPAGGHSDGAFDFAGNGNFVRLPDESAFDFSNRFTVMFWMRIPGFVNPWEQLIGKGDSSWSIDRFGTSRRIAFTTWGPTADELVSTAILDDNEWHHVAVTYDGATKKLYVDGQLDAQRAYTRTISTNNLEVRLGFNEQYSAGQYSGLLDDVRIYDRGLSLSEIQQDMGIPVP